MKTFSSAILLLLMACFAFNNANAQSPKVSGEGSFPIAPGDYIFPCLGEDVSGILYVEWFEINSKIQEKYWVTLVGETTGNVYTSTQVSNFSEHSNNFTQTVNFKIRLDGKLLNEIHITIHYTEVDGELSADHVTWAENCK
ncbi:MAG: hypothetical protein ACWGNV_15040 [Bacteroidales bacterium]